MKKITIILPAYNEAASIDHLHHCMEQVLKDNPNYAWEFLLIDDGSTDTTLQQIIRLHKQDPAHFSYIELSRNYGKEVAMMAGFDYATGDAIINMDADMQHPISVIPEMISYWEQGYDDVYAERRSSKETWFKRKTSQLYYAMLQRFTRIPIQQNTGDFRLLDRSCVEALKHMRESERNTKGLYSWIGFHKKGILFDQLERTEGKSKFSFWQLMNLAINGFTSYTIVPLRLSTFFGMMVSLGAFIYLLYILISTWVFGDPVAGYPTIMVTILFLGGVQLLSIGILGEYLGKVFNESKHRPGYFVREYNGQTQGNIK